MDIIRSNLKQQAIIGTKWTGLSTVIVVIFQFIQLTILGRVLKPSDFGLMGMVSVVYGFAIAFIDLGISDALICKQDITKEQQSSLFWLNIISGSGTMILVLALSPLIALFYHESILIKLIVVISFIFPITSCGQEFQGLMRKELLFNDLAKIEICSSLIGMLVAVSCALLGQGVYALIYGQIATASLKSVFLMIVGLKIWKIYFLIDFKVLKPYFSFGFYQMGESVIKYFNSNLDYILIGSLIGKVALGYYIFAYNLIIVPYNKINPMVSRVAFPILSKMQNDFDYLKKGYFKILEILCLVNFPIFFGLFVTAPVFIPVVFGVKWTPSIILIQILIGVGILRSIAAPAGDLILSRGRADLGFKWNAMLMLMQIPGIYFGLYCGGVLGVAIASLILQILYFILSYFVLIKAVLGSCFFEYILIMRQIFIFSLIMALVLATLSFFIFMFKPIVFLTINILTGSLIYILLVYYYKRNTYIEIKKMIFKI